MWQPCKIHIGAPSVDLSDEICSLFAAVVSSKKKFWRQFQIIDTTLSLSPFFPPLSFLSSFCVSVTVRRHRQYPHQPRHPQLADSGEQVGHRSHARLSGSVLQLLVWDHSASECELVDTLHTCPSTSLIRAPVNICICNECNCFIVKLHASVRDWKLCSNSPYFLICAHFHCMTQSVCLPGILPANRRVLPHPPPSQNGMLPRAHGPLHHAAGSTEGRHEETGVLPSSQGLLVALRRHHRVRLLLSSCGLVSPRLWLDFRNLKKRQIICSTRMFRSFIYLIDWLFFDAD